MRQTKRLAANAETTGSRTGRGTPIGPITAAAALILGLSAAEAQGNRFLVAQHATSQPPGSVGLCATYGWVCARTGTSAMDEATALRLARKINTKVNRGTRHVEDRRQYGREEHWALPTARGGDCEDLVLLKKKQLVEAGVASGALLISTVLDRDMNSHAVLVFRTSGGDLILDNLTNKILPWSKTGYTFLKVQNPRALERWDAVMAGGIIAERPTATN